MPPLLHEALTRSVIGAFYDVYNTLGYGFLEHIYALALELRARGHRVERELGVMVIYKGEELTTQRLDLVVDEKLVVEIKSTRDLPAAAARQVFNYLRATSLQVGLVLHFGPAPKFVRVIATTASR
jgi:GxxExxY protein